MKFIKKLPLGIILFTLFSIIVLALSIRGIAGTPSQNNINNLQWKENGPFELSPERGRYALTYSIIENHSVNFSVPLARFTAPDVAYYNGKYVSLFAPLLSYIVSPGYLLGKFFGGAQIGTFAVISVFAVLNFILIYKNALLLKANKTASLLAATTFLFGTPAFSYAVNLYQHHVSTFLILLSIYLLIKSQKVVYLAIVFLLCAIALPLDYPNLFLMLPVGLYATSRIIYAKRFQKKINISINLKRILAPTLMILPILFFLWFNTQSYGGPFNFLGGNSVEAVKVIGANGKPVTVAVHDKSSTTTVSSNNGLSLFHTRNFVNGLYIHLLSPDRGIINYAPIVLFGVLGFIFSLKKKVKYASLLISVVAANIILYSMWGDPWGGWAFGSRYLIPSYAILSIFSALLLTYWRRNIIFILIFTLISFYSVAINTLGALTTSALPPQVEVLGLEKVTGLVQKYTYAKNWDLMGVGDLKSFFFNQFASNVMSAFTFYKSLTISIWIVITGAAFYLHLSSNKKEDQKNA